MSSESAESATPRRPGGARRLAVGALVLIAGCLALGWYVNPGGIFRDHFVPAAVSFDGGSDALSETAVVPTLDTPIPEGKSAVWCAAMQLAWNRLKEDVVKEPIRLQGAEEVAGRLNRAEQSEADLSADEYFAVAGLAGSEAAERIRREMGRRFPHVPIGDVGVGTLAYAYLQTTLKFTTPYYETDAPLIFKSSAGQETDVTSFGVSGRGELKVRDQVRVLFAAETKGWGERPEDAILDLDVNSSPNQIVIALMKPASTLKEKLARMQQLQASWQGPEEARQLLSADVLVVPSMHWRVNHHFKELEAKVMLNPSLAGQVIDSATQKIDFRLDRSGVALAAEARITVKSADVLRPRAFQFDRPFLLYVKKRTAQHPFLVVWVANAELLQKR